MSAQMLKCGEVGNLDVFTDDYRELRDAKRNEMRELSELGDNDCLSMNAKRLKSSVSDEFVSLSGENRVLVDVRKEVMGEVSNISDYSEDLVHVSNNRARELTDVSEGKKPMAVTEGIDEMDDNYDFVNEVNGRYSVSGFLKNVIVKEMGDGDAANGGNHKLVVFAVHAVMLESGFVHYDPMSGMKVDGYHLTDEWLSSTFGISLHYTLPKILSSQVVDTVVLKFQILGKYVNVYGSVSNKGCGIHRVCLDVSKFNFIWTNSDNTSLEKDNDGSTKLYPNQETLEFWKIVKDGISYPLLIELCEQTGMTPPPCFMLLPTELKLKILEGLPAIDVAKVACVSLELHAVASNNDLWKMKYEEEFGYAAGLQRETQWKAKLGFAWEIRKKIRSMRVCQHPRSGVFSAGSRNPLPVRTSIHKWWRLRSPAGFRDHSVTRMEDLQDEL